MCARFSCIHCSFFINNLHRIWCLLSFRGQLLQELSIVLAGCKYNSGKCFKQVCLQSLINTLVIRICLYKMPPDPWRQTNMFFKYFKSQLYNNHIPLPLVSKVNEQLLFICTLYCLLKSEVYGVLLCVRCRSYALDAIRLKSLFFHMLPILWTLVTSFTVFTT